MKEIGGRVAVVTGASSGLGRHIAETLFDHGLKVVITAREADELEAMRSGFDRTGRRSLAVPGDITSARHRASLLDAAQQTFGAVDILVNNAGQHDPGRLALTTLGGIRSMFDVNVIALMDLTRLALPAMVQRHEGHIVNMASLAGLAPVPHAATYSATEHAVIGFSQSLRREVAEEGVGVSVVCPGFVGNDGLFRQNVGDSPTGQPTISPQQVADAVVEAITGNRDRVTLSPAGLRLAPIVSGVSPALAAVSDRLKWTLATVRGIAGRVEQQES